MIYLIHQHFQYHLWEVSKISYHRVSMHRRRVNVFVLQVKQTQPKDRIRTNEVGMK